MILMNNPIFQSNLSNEHKDARAVRILVDNDQELYLSPGFIPFFFSFSQFFFLSLWL